MFLDRTSVVYCRFKGYGKVGSSQVGFAGAIWSFRRQDGDVQDVSTYIVLPLCVESVVSS